MSTAPHPAPWPADSQPRRKAPLLNPTFVPEGLPPRSLRPRKANNYRNALTDAEARFIDNARSWFHGRPINAEPNDKFPDLLFQAGYYDIWQRMHCGCKKTVKRMMSRLQRKHVVTCWERGHGDRKTWWVLHQSYGKVISARREDSQIGKDAEGSMYVRGRAKRFLDEIEIELWQINRRLASGDPENDAREPASQRGRPGQHCGPLPDGAVTRIREDYELFTGHKWKDRDAVSLAELAGVAEEHVRLGLQEAFLRCQGRMNSFRYAVGSIRKAASALGPSQAEQMRAHQRRRHVAAKLAQLGLSPPPSPP